MGEWFHPYIRLSGEKMKKEKLILILIIVIYTIVSFINLGDNTNPQTLKKFEKNESTYLYITEKTEVDKIKIYIGNNISDLKIYLSPSRDSTQKYYLDTSYFDYTSIFTWQEIYTNLTLPFSYIVIESNSENNVLGEIAAYNQNGEKLKLKTIDEKDKNLVDEQEAVPDEISFLNSTYFDEIYHVRTAFEQLNDIEPYECVHPPLGKIIISIPIYLFGMTAFNYRLMGNIAGILMILVMYCIGKTIFRKERYGLISASIMALDGMHFVQTRIATVDSFLVLFCLTSFLFMMKYIYTDKSENLRKKLKYLLLSGIFIGMAIATKWTAFFVALGLAILFFYHMIYNIIKSKSFDKNDLKILGFCVLFFVIIPIGIYLISYIPLFLNEGCRIKDVNSFIKYQQNIYEYHSTLEATHPFTSSWYTWPILYKPMWYYVGYFGNNLVSTISCMGNPFIWWIGIITTVVISLIYTLIKRNKESAILLVMIASTWIPYVFIGRVMFIYHYFITLPFVMLSIVFFLKQMEEKLHKKFLTIIILIVFLLGFIYFYPVYSGKKVSKDYIEQTKWMDSWIY